MRVLFCFLLTFSSNVIAQINNQSYFIDSFSLLIQTEDTEVRTVDCIVNSRKSYIQTFSSYFRAKKYFTAHSRKDLISITTENQYSADSEVLKVSVKSKVDSETNTGDKTLDLSVKGMKSYAIIVGISDYMHDTNELKDLENPSSDANSLYNVLIDSYKFDSANTFLLTNSTRSAILEKLEEVGRKLDIYDNLLIYFAGHGIWDEFLKKGYWLTYESEINDKSTWLSNSIITDYIAAMPSRHTLLISDACFSGAILKTRSAQQKEDLYSISKLLKLPSRKAMTSGNLTTVPDKSIFSQKLIQTLERYDGQFLSASSLFNQIQEAVLSNSSAVPQYGVIFKTGHEGGDFIFFKK